MWPALLAAVSGVLWQEPLASVGKLNRWFASGES